MIEIRTIAHAEEVCQLTELFALSFGQSTTAALWEWKYAKNPLARFMPHITVAMDGGKVVGARPYLLSELWLNHEKVIAAQHCDTMVHPDYRRQGIFNRMGREAVRYLYEHGCMLSYGFPGPMSRRGFLSQGYRKLLPNEILFRLVKPGQIIACNVKNRPLGKSLGYLCDLVPLSKGLRVAPEARDYQVEVSACYPDEMKVLDSFRKKTVIDLARTESYMRWRFDAHPERSYRYILAKKGGSLEGYALVSVQKQRRGVIAGFIVDYLVKGDDRACFHALMVRALQEIEENECHVVVAWAAGDPGLRRELLEHFAFRSSANFPYRKVMDTGYMDVLLVDERKAGLLDVYDKNNWRVTYAYPNFT